MREHPLLMKGPLVRATLAGLKTQTRRPIKCGCNQLHKGGNPVKLFGDWSLSVPPHQYAGGDLYSWCGKRRPELGDWIEKVQTDVDDCLTSRVACPLGKAGDRLWVRETWTAAMHDPKGPADCLYRADDNRGVEDLAEAKWTPSIHMPRWACRLVLPLVSVRVERVQDITEADAKAEGVEPIGGSYREGFREVWQGIYGPKAWDENWWVWVAEWREIEVRK